MASTYEQLTGEIDTLLESFSAFAVAIDGMKYAGKSTLAAHLSKKYGAPVLHMEDFLLPQSERPDNWEDTPGGGVDFARFREEIYLAWKEKRPIAYSLRNPVTGEDVKRMILPEARMYIVEGTYATHPEIPDFYDLRIFCRVSAEEQVKRANAGEGLSMAELARERAYFATYLTEELSDVVVDEGLMLPPLEE